MSQERTYAIELTESELNLLSSILTFYEGSEARMTRARELDEKISKQRIDQWLSAQAPETKV